MEEESPADKEATQTPAAQVQAIEYARRVIELLGVLETDIQDYDSIRDTDVYKELRQKANSLMLMMGEHWIGKFPDDKVLAVKKVQKELLQRLRERNIYEIGYSEMEL